LEGVVFKRVGKTCAEGFPCSWIVGESKVAPDNVLEQSDSLSLYQLGDHVGQNGPDSVETLVRVTDISQTGLVEQDLLDNEDCHSFRKLRSSFHNPEAKRDDFSGEQEVDYGGVVILLDESAYNPKGCQPEILEGASLRSCIKEGVQKQWKVGIQKQLPGIRMGGDTLQKGQCVADPIRCVCSKSRRRK